MLGFDIAYWCTKFDHSSFSRSRDVVGASQNLSGSRDLTTPLRFAIRGLKLATVILPTKCELYLRPL